MIREFARFSRNFGVREMRQIFLKRNLLIFRERILDSRVAARTPSCDAAPNGPETRPSVAANTASMASFSSAAGLRTLGAPVCLRGEDSNESQLGSTEKTSSSQKMTDRSITFCSSRTLPGQAYDCSRSKVRFSIVAILLPALRA